MKKKENLNKYDFGTSTGFYSKTLNSIYNNLSDFFKGEDCLELGCADGEGTKILLKYFKNVIAVDGSQRQIDLAKKRIKNKNVTFISSYFETLELDQKFDTIILAHILEHVDDPVLVLKVAKKFLNKDGIIIIDVPNAMSIHRQVGVLMGMIKNEHDLNDSDQSVGHKRVYDESMILKDVKKSGLLVREKGGILLKPFSNKQLDLILSQKGVDAYAILGRKYPEIAAEIYLVCYAKF